MKFTSNPESLVQFSFLGLIEYQKSLEIQNQLHELSQSTKNHYIIGLEHPAVITLGLRARAEDEVFADTEIPVVRINRGGFATLHSEGQLVVYGVLNLRELGLGVRDYVYLLLETTRGMLSDYGVRSNINEEALGLYTANGKIAFCGIQVKGGVSQHGISINIGNDLKLFSGIRSCGSHHSVFDSLTLNAQKNPGLSEVFSSWQNQFYKKISF